MTTERLSPGGRQSIAAVNARVYAMSVPDRERWYAGHPASSFADPPAVVKVSLDDLRVVLEVCAHGDWTEVAQHEAYLRLCQAAGEGS